MATFISALFCLFSEPISVYFSVNYWPFSMYLFVPDPRSIPVFQIFCKDTKFPRHSQMFLYLSKRQ